MMSLRNLGQQILSRNTSVEDAAKVWNFFVHHYLVQSDPEAPSTAVRIEMLRLRVGPPPGEAWKALRARIPADIDNLSGWTRSIRKELAERHQVWLGEDGNYYGKESDGAVYSVVGVIGAQTLEEARLDFHTEQITREFGVVRMFLQFFSWLVVQTRQCLCLASHLPHRASLCGAPGQPDSSHLQSVVCVELGAPYFIRNTCERQSPPSGPPMVLFRYGATSHRSTSPHSNGTSDNSSSTLPQ